MSALSLVQAATLQRFLHAWEKWDAEEFLAVFANDFTQVTLPLGLGIPTKSRAEVEQVFPALIAVVKSYQLTIHDIVHDAAKNKAVIYASSKGTLPWGPWSMEYSAFVTFSEAGDKVARLEEMLDTAFLQDFAPKFGQYLQANGGPRAVAAGAGAEGQGGGVSVAEGIAFGEATALGEATAAVH